MVLGLPESACLFVERKDNNARNRLWPVKYQQIDLEGRGNYATLDLNEVVKKRACKSLFQ